MIYLVLVLAISSPEQGNVQIRGNIQSMEICQAVADSLRIDDRVKEANCYKVDK